MDSHNSWVVTHSVDKDWVRSLLWWSDRHSLSWGMHFTFPNTTITITTDANMEGWGGHYTVPRSGTALFSDLWTYTSSTSMC